MAHDESPRTTIAQALRVLEGQAISKVVLEPGSGSAIFTFDLGATLRTKASEHGSHSDDEADEPVTQWWLMGPEGRVLDVREDAMFSIHNDGASRGDEVWLPLAQA